MVPVFKTPRENPPPKVKALADARFVENLLYAVSIVVVNTSWCDHEGVPS